MGSIINVIFLTQDYYQFEFNMAALHEPAMVSFNLWRTSYITLFIRHNKRNKDISLYHKNMYLKLNFKNYWSDNSAIGLNSGQSKMGIFSNNFSKKGS